MKKSLAGLMVVLGLFATGHAAVLGTAFTYQGRLTDNGQPANGSHDLRFILFTAGSGGNQIANTLTNEDVTVNNGLFAVELDFGAGVFDGSAHWLEVAVRAGTNTGSFTLLSPRQPLTPTPNALFAVNASLATTAASAGSAIAVSANGVNTAALQAAAVNSAKIADGTITAADVNASTFNTIFWKTDGNTSTLPGTHFLGTTDNQPLEIKANNRRALRLEASGVGAPNVIGGSEVNSVDASVVGATIAGGGAANYAGFVSSNRVSFDFGAVGGGLLNWSRGYAATVGGGQGNSSSGGAATVGGGRGNSSSNSFATVSGGDDNRSDGIGATVGGGRVNTSSGENSTVAGGFSNTSSGSNSTVAGGDRNTSSGYAAAVGGGRENTNSGHYGTVGGGFANFSGGEFAITAGGEANISSGDYAVVGGGFHNISSNSWATIPGGYQNIAGGQLSFAAGRRAQAMHDGAFVWADADPGATSFGDPFASTGTNQFLIRAAGGVGINTNSPGSALHVNGTVTASSFSGSGEGLTALNPAALMTGNVAAVLGMTNAGNIFTGNGGGLTGVNATALGGLTPSSFWQLGGNAGTLPGTHFLGTPDNRPLDFRVNNQRALRLTSTRSNNTVNVLGGSPLNLIDSGVMAATISGGGTPEWFGGPRLNSVASDFATVGGGADNRIGSNSLSGVISGGFGNRIQNGTLDATIGGGTLNLIGSDAPNAVIAGGQGNIVSNANVTIGGGGQNLAIGLTATIGGGYQNQALNTDTTIGGGYTNTAAGYRSTIAGGALNLTSGDFSTVSGGQGNLANGSGSTIAGGLFNQVEANANRAVISGGNNNIIRFNAEGSGIGAGSFNVIGTNAQGAHIAGGFANVIGTNSANATIGGGQQNTLSGTNSMIGGGDGNNISGHYCTVAGGHFNAASIGSHSAIGGGNQNTANGSYSTVPGGFQNHAVAPFSFAAGNRAKASFQGAFVWADSQSADFFATTTDEVSFRCLRGVRFTSAGAGANQTVSWVPGSASWSFSSDRNLKEKVKSVDAQAVLEKVSRLSVAEWSYKGYPQRHIGPMAQDFHALFPLNDNDRMLDGGDLHGVALAAIQGLNKKLEEKLREQQAELKTKGERIAALESSVTDLKEAVGRLLAERK